MSDSMDIQDRPGHLDEQQALSLLAILAKNHAASGMPDKAVLAAIDHALGLPAEQPPGMSDGAMARLALGMLAEDEQFAAALAALLAGPAPERFGIVETGLLIGGLLLVLQTQVKIERKADGSWTWKIEKKPTDDKLLKALIGKLLGHFGD